MRIYLEREIRLKDSPLYDSDEINEIYNDIISSDPAILKAK